MAQGTSTSRRRRTAAPTAATRLPSTRERRPAMAALAVLLIVGGALASGWLALRTGHRADYLRVEADVAQGQQIDDAHLGVVSLPDDLSDEYILADRREEVVGMEATTPLRPGMVLTPNLYDEDAGTDEGHVEPAFQMPELEIPAGMTDGSPIVVVLTTTDSKAADATTVAGEVVRIERPEDGEGGIGGGASSAVASVTVSIPASCSTRVAQAYSDDALSIYLRDPAEEEVAVVDPCVEAAEGSE